VGDAEENDGVMLLVARFDRKLRIEIGAGYSSAFDSRMKRIIDDVIVPYFRSDQYGVGIEEGVREVIFDLAGSYPGEFDATAAERFSNNVQRTVGEPQWWWALGGVPFAGWGVFAYRRYRRNKPRICPIDGEVMYRVDEFVDDEHLEDGQRLEERLKSVDYDVWRCARCGHVTIEAYRSWFSKFGACPSCEYRTLEGEETILIRATTSRSGRKRIDYTCRHCGHFYSETRTIPKKSKSRSSSGGGSSFGGGSSSGGGASGSW
ncbi:MAG: TPM domain-containing protein, partial [Pseudomonadota bacterium]